MNNVALLDQMFAAYREVLRLIVDTATTSIPASDLSNLVQRRDQLTVQIQTVILTDLKATMSQLDAAVTAIDASVTKLEGLQATLADIQTAVSVAKKILDVVGEILAVV